jgi:tetratricopeptide (TPR) repeat protein
VSGRPAPVAACLLALAVLAAAPLPAWALVGDTEVTANQGVAAGGNITGSTINIGIPYSELPGIIQAATKPLEDLTDKQRQDLELLRVQLEVSAGALRSFLLNLGEADVPVEQVPAKLEEIAQRYKDLLVQLQKTSSTDPEVQWLKGEARAALDTGDFARAEELLNQAKARDLSAIEQMRAAIERMQADLDARQLSAAEAAAENGALMMAQLRYAEAAHYYAEAVGLTPERYAEQLSARLTGWALAAQAAGDYGTGLDAARRALVLDEARLPAEHPILATRLNNLAGLYQDTGRYEQAEPLYRRVLAIFEGALGPEHPNVATAASNLAGLYQATGRYEQAEPLLQRAIAIREEALGPGHPDLAQSLTSLATLYRDTGRLAEAEPLFQRALAIAGKSLPPDHPAQALYRDRYAGLLEKLGRSREASELRARAEVIRQ